MSEDKPNDTQDGVDEADEFEFAATDGSAVVTMNERVTRLASALRQKLKNQIQQYGEEPVRELMPLLVEVLDALNTALQDDHENVLTLQELREENGLLWKQYQAEKEKKLLAEQALIHLEDQVAEERKDTKDEMQQLKNTTRQLQAQLKNHQERADRIEQRHDELHAEHAELQEKHRKSVQQYVKLARQSTKSFSGRNFRSTSLDLMTAPALNISSVGVGPIEMFAPSSPSSQVLCSSPRMINSPVTSESPRVGYHSPKNRKHLQREIEESTKKTKVITRRESEYTVRESTHTTVTLLGKQQETTGITDSETVVRVEPIGSSDMATVVEGRPDSLKPMGEETLACPLDDTEDSQDVSVMSGELLGESTEAGKQGNVDLSDVDQQDEERFAREQKRAIEMSEEDTLPNENCLYDELGPDSAAEMDEAVELSKVSLEIQQLVDENRELEQKRNHLSKEHDDLVSRVGILSSEKEGLAEEMDSTRTENASLKETIKNLKQRLEEEKQKTENTEPVKPDEQKRYTRLEMAKVLEQRDYYKERFLSLQEEISCSEETPLFGSRVRQERSPVFRFFQTLFRKPKYETVETQYGSADPIDAKFYAQIRGSQDRGNTVFGDTDVEDGRVHAYGWSLPNGELNRTISSLSVGMSGRRLPLPVHPVETFPQPIPVPITAGPLMQQDKSLRVTCGVSLNSREWCCPSLEPVIVPGANAHVWLCTAVDAGSKGSDAASPVAKIFVLDANKPTDIVDSFDVSGEVLCCVSVPSSETENAESKELGPTVWLGTVDGLYVHSAVADRGQNICGVSTSSTILHLLFQSGRVFAGQTNGSVTMFMRETNGLWDWANCRSLEPAERKDVPVGAMSIVRGAVWVAVDCKVYELDVKNFKVATYFESHSHNCVVLMASMGDGVWMAFKNDSSLKLFHADTHEVIQDLDVSPHVQRLLNMPAMASRQPTSVKVVQLMLADSALWIGTSNGMIMAVPLTLSQELQLRLLQRAGELRATIRESKLPCCFSWDVRINLHGHVHGIRALVATPSSARDSQETIKDGFVFVDSRKCLIVAAGEGYVDFRAKEGTLASVHPVAKTSSPVRSPTPSECVYVSAWEISTRAVLEGSTQTT